MKDLLSMLVFIVFTTLLEDCHVSAILFLLKQGEQPPLERIKPSRSRNLEEALSESDTQVMLAFVCVSSCKYTELVYRCVCVFVGADRPGAFY